MPYSAVLIYSSEGDFLGYGIRKPEPSLQLKSVNIWSEEERADLERQTQRLNGDIELKAHWPKVDDPEVLKLIQDPNWEPIEMEEVQEVDEENSLYIPALNAAGAQTGEIDWEASVIAHLPARMAPVRPIEAQARTKKAQETVAQQRAAR